jgi:hypothetical protein
MLIQASLDCNFVSTQNVDRDHIGSPTGNSFGRKLLLLMHVYRCLQGSRDCGKKGVDYSGHTLPLRLGELLPGLPGGEVAGSLNAADVADDGFRTGQCLLPCCHKAVGRLLCRELP